MNNKPCTSRVLRSLALVLIPVMLSGEATAHGLAAPDHTQEHQDSDHATPSDRRGPDRFLIGDSTKVGGRRLLTWAVLARTGSVEEVGLTVPLAVFDKQPGSSDGPLGAIASLEFPKIVQETTYFNHVEIHSNPDGHPSDPSQPDRYFVPHFDLHFYALPEAVVWGIPAAMPPLAEVPPEKLPVGWYQPGPGEPQMGRHSIPWSIADGPFTAEMIVGYLPSGKQMHFIEPMVTRERLLKPIDFELPVPRPTVFGRTMLYPASFKAEYDHKLKAWHFVFREFGLVE